MKLYNFHMSISNSLEANLTQGAADINPINQQKLTAVPASGHSRTEIDWIQKVKTIFEKNLNNYSLSIEQIAHEMHISPRQFQRRVKQLTGLSPKLFLQEYRLQKAQMFLNTQKYHTVKETARAAGFKNSRYFSRLFRKHFGVSPSSLLKKQNLSPLQGKMSD